MGKRWLSNEDLAELLGVPLGTVRRWRYIGEGPSGVVFGRHVRYDADDVARWIEARRKAQAVAAP